MLMHFNKNQFDEALNLVAPSQNKPESARCNKSRPDQTYGLIQEFRLRPLSCCLF